MSNRIKTSELYNRQVSSVHKIEPIDRDNYVPILRQKSESHNMPQNTSDNEDRLIEAFYAKTHNLKANYTRLKDSTSQQSYYKTHRSEAYAGGFELIEAINMLLDEASKFDLLYNTYNHFLIIGLLHAHGIRLQRIGIEMNKDERVFLRKKIFYDALINNPDAFDFLFDEPHSLIGELDKFYIQMVTPESPSITGGQILDLKG